MLPPKYQNDQNGQYNTNYYFLARILKYLDFEK